MNLIQNDVKDSELLSSFILNAIDGIITIDEKGIIQSFNPSASKLFGYSPDEVFGKNISLLMPPPDSIQHDYYLSRYKQTGQKRIIGVGRAVTGLRKDGTKFPLKLGVSEVRVSDQKYYVGFIHDLSEQKQYQERLKDYASHLEELVEIRTKSLNENIAELEKAKEVISISLRNEQELGKLKTRFISIASHEFRTPLSTIQLSSSLIEKYAAPFAVPEITKHTAKIKASVAGLTIILNNFLQMERLESGGVQTNLSDFDLVTLAEDITEEMRLFVKSNQQITYTHNGSDRNIKLDKDLIRNCILNLISNAIKYSGDDALIEFCTEIQQDSCQITLKDNGIGIPEDDQKFLFEAFFRAHNIGSIPGTGLGLNIVARHVSLMNGTIGFKSDAGKGTLFTLTFPRQ